MTLHAIIRLAIHRMKAKRLHGVHSPFVFDFAKHVLAASGKFAVSDSLRQTHALSKQQLQTVSSILRHYNYQMPIVIGDDEEEIAVAADVLILRSDKPGNWVRIFNKYNRLRKTNCVFVVTGIHQTKRHTAKWHRLCSYPMVPLSIDLYNLGLIWYHPSFKEKQHFVLY